MKMGELVKTLLLSALVVAATGCKSNLTRNQAEKLILAKCGFTRTKEVDLFVGVSTFDSGTPRNWDRWFQAAGLITGRATRMTMTSDGHGWQGYDSYETTLTDAGKAAVKEWQLVRHVEGLGTANFSNEMGRGGTRPSKYEGDLYRVTVGKVRFVEVTGITTNESGGWSSAEFTWSWEPRGDYGRALLAVGEDALGLSLAAHKNSARFQRYDDGWRLVECDCP